MSPQFSHNFDVLTLNLEELEPLSLAPLMRLLLVCLATYCYFIHIPKVLIRGIVRLGGFILKLCCK